jgi:ligand-binding SRPBCC domain-containing protein
MPVFERQIQVRRPAAEVFEFFARPANLPLVTPPDWHLQVLEAPERLQVGSRVTVQGRRMGVAQKIVTEVTACEPPTLIVDEQRQGPFRKWIRSHRFASHGGGTRITERIEFEPPGGLLGLVVTVGLIERDLVHLFAYREQKLKELLDGPDRTG